jgi:hypothetical protein
MRTPRLRSIRGQAASRFAQRGAVALCALAGVLGVTPGAALAAGAPEAPASEAASALTASTATLHGMLNPGASTEKVAYYFAYNIGAECTGAGTAPAEPPLPEAEGNHKKVSLAVTGLEGNTEYAACLVAESLGEESEATVGTTVHFTTIATKPVVVGESSAEVTPSTAALQAEVNPEDESTQCKFEYGTTSAYGTTTPCEPASLQGTSVQAAGLALTGLSDATTYHYRVVAKNPTGEVAGPDEQFSTVAPPVVSTGEASGVTRVSALLSGTIDPGRAVSTYRFEYIDQAGYAAALAQSAPDPYAEGASTVTQEIPAGDEPQALPPAPATGLLPETTYHYVLIAHNAAGTVTGQDATFTTGPTTPPLVTTGGVSDVTLSSATLSGTVDTQGLAVGYAFELSTNPNESGAPTGAGLVDIGVSEATVSIGLQGLQPGTTYYYRALASSLDGTSYGAVQTFTTPGVGNALTPPAAPPLIAVPAIAFPTEASTPAIPTTKKLTKAQKLANALRTCKKKAKSKRAACERQAHKLYGPVKQSKQK